MDATPPKLGLRPHPDLPVTTPFPQSWLHHQEYCNYRVPLVVKNGNHRNYLKQFDKEYRKIEQTCLGVTRILNYSEVSKPFPCERLRVVRVSKSCVPIVIAIC